MWSPEILYVYGYLLNFWNFLWSDFLFLCIRQFSVETQIPRVGMMIKLTHWDIADAERSLFKVSLIWLTGREWSCHKFPLWESLTPREKTTHTGMRNCLNKHYHKMSYLPFVSLKAHLLFLWKPFLSPCIPLLNWYINPYL